MSDSKHVHRQLYWFHLKTGFPRGYCLNCQRQSPEKLEEAKTLIGPTAVLVWSNHAAAREAFPLLPDTAIDQACNELQGIERNRDSIKMLPAILFDLAVAFKYVAIREKKSDQSYLNNAIELIDKAASLSQETGLRWSNALFHSAVMREQRYRLGMQEDLQLALKFAISARNAMEKENPHYVECLDLLAIIHGHLYEKTPQTEYLEAGLKSSTEAILVERTSSPKGDGWARLMMTHTNLQALKSVRMDDRGLLNEAIESLNAVASLCQKNLTRTSLLFCLGKRYLERSRHEYKHGEVGKNEQKQFPLYRAEQDHDAQRESDLLHALKYHHRAVVVCPSDHGGQRQFLNTLAEVYLERYDRFLDVADLAAALNAAKRASAARGGLAHQQSHTFMMAAKSLEKVADANDSQSTLDASIALYKRVISFSASPLFAKAVAAMTVGKIDFLAGKMEDALQHHVAAIDSIENRSTQFDSLDDLQHTLDSTVGLSTFAAALMLEANCEPWEALQVLERGRGTIINTALGRRAGQIATDPEIARADPAKARQEFQDLAEFGPIVAFNATGLRSDAFIVTHSEVKAIRLNGIKYEQLAEYTQLLSGPRSITGGLWSERDESNKKLHEFLKWLWDWAVSPVLCELGFLPAEPNDPPRRIWWVTSGLLGLAPLHAAGHLDSKTKNTYRYVISSYVPTLKALRQARQKSSLVDPKDNETLVVTVPQTAGYPGELNSNDDARAIEQSMKNAEVEADVLNTPSKDEVLSKLNHANNVYFACHGEVDTTDPANSGLLLKEGLDGRPQRLTFRDIANNNRYFEPNRMACLLACSTAKSDNERLTDEMLHIVSGFQIVGFPHVIGSLWDVDDDITTDIARAFAERMSALVSDGDMRDSTIAKALHEAVNSKRLLKHGKISKNVLGWAPFVHFGC